MSWSDFMDTKHFGPGVFRPYADLIADIEREVDNLLGSDPAFAKFTQPLLARDFVFVRGKRIALLCVSHGSHRHYPTRSSYEWDNFWTLGEDAIVAARPQLLETAEPIELPELDSHLLSQWNFANPVCLGLPAIYSVQADSPEGRTRAAAVSSAARILVAADRTHYEAHLEMQKPKDIFLSHKSVDKELVREVAATLRSVGLSPWLDEDRMRAGANLERALRAGFDTSCAAVFFITPNYVDEGFLASEVDYAIAEKRAKGDRFSIITLQISDAAGAIGEVPALLRPFVWKQVQPLQIVRTIVDALPIKCGPAEWR